MNHAVTTNPPSKYMFAVLLFLYAITFLEVQNTFSIVYATDFFPDIFDKGQAKLLHILLYTAFLAFGMYVFARSYRKFTQKEQKFILVAVILIKLASSSFYTLHDSALPVLYLGALSVFAVCEGFISALILTLALQNIKKQHLSMFIGTALSLGMVITIVTGFFLDYGKNDIGILENYLGQLVLIAGLYYVREALTLKNHSVNRYEKTSSSMRGYLLMCVLIVILLSLIHGFSDGMQIMVLERHTVEYVHADFRFFYIISLLLAGVLFEKLKNYRIMLALLAMVLILMCLYLYEYEELYLYTFALAEFASGFFIIFVICIFINVANSTRSPLLWCNCGRIIECPVNTIGAILGFQIFSYASNLLLLFATLSLFFVVMMLLFRYSSSYQASSRLNNVLNLYEKEREQRLKFQKKIDNLNSELESLRNMQKSRPPEEKKALPAPQSMDNSNQFEKFIRDFALTAKEQEVLEEIRKMKPIRDIAEKLSISERTVKYRIASILKKAQVKNQRELILRYFSDTND